MAEPGFPPESFDLVWSEGALYNIGIARALDVCSRLLEPGGYLVFSDAVWTGTDPPPQVRQVFDEDYPGMGTVPELLALVAASGLRLQGHFPLPNAAWWTDFYTPMEARLAALRPRYAADPEALAVLDQIGGEIALHRQHARHYAYEVVVARRPP